MTTGFIKGKVVTDNGGTFGGAITLSNAISGYSPSPLDYYEEYNGSVAASTPLNETPDNLGFRLTRIGRVVSLTLYDWGNFQPTSDSEIEFATGSIPTRYAPTAGGIYYQPVYNNNSSIVSGLIKINTDGSIIFYSSANLGTFSSAGLYYQYGSSATWSV